MRLAASLLLSAVLLSTATYSALADTLDTITITGATGTFSAALPSSATPFYSSASETIFNLASATYDGQAIANDLLTVYTTGGIVIQTANAATYIDEFAPILFTGSTANPVFSIGTFTSPTGVSVINGATLVDSGDTIKITSQPLSSPVPEPSSCLLSGSGALGLIALLRRRPVA